MAKPATKTTAKKAPAKKAADNAVAAAPTEAAAPTTETAPEPTPAPTAPAPAPEPTPEPVRKKPGAVMMEQIAVQREEMNGAKTRVLVQQGRRTITPAEYLILEQMHGDGMIHIMGVGEPVERTSAEEKDRLSMIYDRESNRQRGTGLKPTEVLFPGRAPVPASFEEIGVSLPGDDADVPENEREAEIDRLERKLAALKNSGNAKAVGNAIAKENQKAADEDGLV